MTQTRLFPIIDMDDRYDDASNKIEEELVSSDKMDLAPDDDSNQLDEELIKIFQELCLRGELS